MQNKQLISIRIAGGICLLFMAFHGAFNSMLKWNETLSCLSTDNRAILLTYHYISILITGFMGLLPFIQGKELLNSKLKYSVLGFFILFFLTRIVTEFTSFGYKPIQSPIIIAMCAIPIVLFAFPLISKKQ